MFGFALGSIDRVKRRREPRMRTQLFSPTSIEQPTGQLKTGQVIPYQDCGSSPGVKKLAAAQFLSVKRVPFGRRRIVDDHSAKRDPGRAKSTRVGIWL